MYTSPETDMTQVPVSLVEGNRLMITPPRTTVLIAEDDPDLRTIFTFTFEYYQFDVKNVRNGQEAIEALEQGLPQVLVLDIAMPLVSGLDVLQYIRERHWHAKMHIIVVTANAGYQYDPVIEIASLFLVKPVSVEHLARFAERLATSQPN